LYRRALLEDVGLPEPSFFAYLEDVDLSWRALLRGWHSVVVPQARVRHVYSATAVQGSPRKQWLLGRNRIRVMIRCLPESLLRYCLPYALCYDLMVMAYALPAQKSAMISGRLAALSELPQLLAQRRAIQARRTASIETLARWLEPPASPWATLRDQRQLDAILRER
jgi:GT2 family glycosyltransferase